MRRDLLTAFFIRLIVYVEDDHIRVESDRNDVNTAIRDFHTKTTVADTQRVPIKTKTPRG